MKKKNKMKTTHIVPPAAGPMALNRDIPVIERPLAAPLWCCSCFPNQYVTIPSKTNIKLCE